MLAVLTMVACVMGILGVLLAAIVSGVGMDAFASFNALHLQLFFLGIVCMHEVPPLFYCTFAAGGLLALDDAEVERACALLRRRS